MSNKILMETARAKILTWMEQITLDISLAMDVTNRMEFLRSILKKTMMISLITNTEMAMKARKDRRSHQKEVSITTRIIKIHKALATSWLQVPHHLLTSSHSKETDNTTLRSSKPKTSTSAWIKSFHRRQHLGSTTPKTSEAAIQTQVCKYKVSTIHKQISYSDAFSSRDPQSTIDLKQFSS